MGTHTPFCCLSLWCDFQGWRGRRVETWLMQSRRAERRQLTKGPRRWSGLPPSQSTTATTTINQYVCSANSNDLNISNSSKGRRTMIARSVRTRTRPGGSVTLPFRRTLIQQHHDACGGMVRSISIPQTRTVWRRWWVSFGAPSNRH
jgi:hypothetical protein